MDGCIFCKIVAREAPVSVVHEDDVVLAFMDILPVNGGHVLVIPKAHAVEMAEMDEETGAHLFRVTMRVADAVRASGVRCEGVNLFLADGEAAGQEVFHLHMHIIPRFAGDRFKVEPQYGTPPTREELDEMAANIHKKL